MGRVIIGSQNRSKAFAGGLVQTPQKRAFLGGPIPPRQYRHTPPVVQNKGGHIDGITKGMFGQFARLSAVDIPATEGAHGLDAYNLTTQILLGGRTHGVSRPVRKVRGQGACHRPQIGRRGSEIHQLDRVDGAASIAETFVWQASKAD